MFDVKSNFEKLISSVSDHEDFLLSGSLAFTIALALAPFVMIMLMILSLIGANNQQQMIEQLSELLGPQTEEVLKTIAVNAEKETHFSGFAGIISFLVIAVSASSIFSQLRIALDKINEYKSPGSKESVFREFLQEKLFSICIVFGFIILLVVSLIISSITAVIFK